jgi:long-subunit fatty acid transport protein
MRKITRHQAIAFLVLAAWAIPTSAQSSLDVFGGFQLNLDTPGAKGLGMAGAIMATANDATAAVVNPAALTRVDRRDVLLEVRQNQPYSEFSSAGAVTQAGQPSSVIGFNQDELIGLGYLSYTEPFEKATLTFYRHVVMDFDSFIRGAGPRVVQSNGNELQTLMVEGVIDLDVESLGTAVGFNTGENFSIGVGVAYQEGALDATNTRYSRRVPFPSDPLNPSREVTVQTATVSDDDLVFNLGLLYEDERWAFAASWRQGAEFDLVAENRVGRGVRDSGEVDQKDLLQEGTCLSQIQDPMAGALCGEGTGSFSTPDVYGVGVSFKATKRLTIALEWDRVTWGDLVQNVADPFPITSRADRLSVDDIDTYHLGFEYFQDHPRFPVALWWGIWEDEGHRVSYEGSLDDLRAASAPQAAHFFAAEDETHYSIGAGFGLGDSANIAISGDFSDSSDAVILDLGFTF